MRVDTSKKDSIIAMIPARTGSKRLPLKNLSLLNGRPLISYAVEAAKDANIFDRIVINSESRIFEKIANRYGVDFYKRLPKLASSQAKSDDVVYDFVKNNPCDIVVWVNPTSPLQAGQDLRKIVTYFIHQKLDSLITVKNEQVHCLYQAKPLNFEMEQIFSRTQDLVPVQLFVYSAMMWKAGLFMKTFREKGHAVFSGKVGFYPVGRLSSVIIKNQNDLMLAESLLKIIKSDKKYEVKYDKLAKLAKQFK